MLDADWLFNQKFKVQSERMSLKKEGLVSAEGIEPSTY
jgi:hypothetical protein